MYVTKPCLNTRFGERNARRKGRREDDEGRDGVGSLIGVGSLMKFWGPERPPPSKIEKLLKCLCLSIGISHQIDPTPKGTQGGGGRRETGPAAPREGRAGGEGGRKGRKGQDRRPQETGEREREREDQNVRSHFGSRARLRARI